MLDLRFVPFSERAFVDEVRRLSAAPPGDYEPGDQVRYLASYLKHSDCGARTLAVEQPYVDRHYLEEFVGYYATLFSPPESKTARIHVFSEELSKESFIQLLKDAGSGRHEEVQRQLVNSYLGFIVVRPLAAAPIGRTILRSYGSSADRVYGPYGAPHAVHLAGLELRVTGTPFQQQDQGVGACATIDGGRGSSPAAVPAIPPRGPS